MTEDMYTEDWKEVLESFKLADGEKEHVVRLVLSSRIRGVDVCMPQEIIFRRDEKTGEQYKQETLIVPGKPYGCRGSTVLVYTNRNGKHLKVLNNCGLHGNSINYLSKEFYGIKQNETVTPKKK
jgi:hypothetical protein